MSRNDMNKTLFILVISAFLLCSCGPDLALVPPCEYEVDPVFRELYEQLGGIGNLGCAISRAFDYTNVTYQYFDTVLMVHDPQGAARPKQRLAPIGREMGIAEPVVPRPEGYDVRYIEGHIIYDAFEPMYERLGGMRYVGKPLTEVHFNPNYQRYEQYFENVGLYLKEGNDPSQVRLLAYGAWQCSASCRQMQPDESTVELPHFTAPQFSEAVTRLGPHFTGFAISEAHQTPDGYLEQVFENVVLVADPGQPSRVFPRPITESLGIFPDPLVERSADPELYFYPLQGENKGYHIPKAFMEYIAQHGGQEAFGAPISERVRWQSNVYRQCFVNLCLEEHLDGPEYYRIHPEQLGYQYLELPVQPVSAPLGGEPAPDANVQAQTAVQPTPPPVEPTPVQAAPQQPAAPADAQTSSSSQPPGQINIQVWEIFPMVASNQNQEIGVSVYENNDPMIGIEPDISVVLPDGSSRSYYMYPTGEDGQTRMLIEPIQAPSGTLIPYEVCIFFPGGQKLCVKDSFLIWDNP